MSYSSWELQKMLEVAEYFDNIAMRPDYWAEHCWAEQPNGTLKLRFRWLRHDEVFIDPSDVA
jgi:hypothetical protein